MSLWWLHPGWTEALCSHCGQKVWPDGDPDWGLCWRCFYAQQKAQEEARLEYERMVMEQMDQSYLEPPK
ncbi:MAG TPA: hypothetical protein VNK52_16235 [Hyphomicrobiaceae bacterium]|nr:hypothetical protein [Hyphomicrobiaceae bacterium]